MVNDPMADFLALAAAAALVVPPSRTARAIAVARVRIVSGARTGAAVRQRGVPRPRAGLIEFE
jgi:hypothetical protein